MVSGETSELMAMGAILGLTAGISPGPLLALVITETITKNKIAGFKIAFAPLITDLPIIAAAFLIFSYAARLNFIMSFISFIGAVFLSYLGLECLKTDNLPDVRGSVRSGSLLKGIAANLLNPHPYLFWITVGTPLALRAIGISVFTTILFFSSFYIMLVGSKVVVALIVDKSKEFLTTKIYKWILKVLGIILLIFALIFMIEGIKGIV
jgi:threonine/homoserine/homoserine lactone efflux protein